MHLNAFKVSSFRHCNGEYAIYISFYNGDKQYFKSEYIYHLYNSTQKLQKLEYALGGQCRGDRGGRGTGLTT